jgi:CBS domain-containing protein
METIKVIDVMHHSPFVISPQKTVKDAARLMKEENCGVLPVGTHSEKIVGIITDRDILLRVTAEGKDASKTLISEVMTPEVQICDGHSSLEDAAEQMSEHNIRRLIVITKDRGMGIVTLAELLRNQGNWRISDKVLHKLLGARRIHHAKKEGTAA